MTDRPIPPTGRDTAGLALPDIGAFENDLTSSLQISSPESGLGLARLLRTRRSERHYAGLSLAELLSVISPLVNPSTSRLAADKYLERFKPFPSAGGRHPHTLLVFANEVHGMKSGAWLVDDESGVMRHFEGAIFNPLLKAVMDVLGDEQLPPAVIVTLANPRRTTSKYPNGLGESLLWRDAGVLLGTLHLLAHELGLASTILGIQRTVSICLRHIDGKQDDELIDTGALALGRKSA